MSVLSALTSPCLSKSYQYSQPLLPLAHVHYMKTVSYYFSSPKSLIISIQSVLTSPCQKYITWKLSVTSPHPSHSYQYCQPLLPYITWKLSVITSPHSSNPYQYCQPLLPLAQVHPISTVNCDTNISVLCLWLLHGKQLTDGTTLQEGKHFMGWGLFPLWQLCD